MFWMVFLFMVEMSHDDSGRVSIKVETTSQMKHKRNIDRDSIDLCKVPGIGEKGAETLKAHGIETVCLGILVCHCLG